MSAGRSAIVCAAFFEMEGEKDAPPAAAGSSSPDAERREEVMAIYRAGILFVARKTQDEREDGGCCAVCLVKVPMDCLSIEL